MRYINKPMVVNAELYKEGMEDGFDLFSIGGTFICSMTSEEMKLGYPRSCKKAFLRIPEGKVYISCNDYIVTDENGDVYPIEKKLFEQLYEEIK